MRTVILLSVMLLSEAIMSLGTYELPTGSSDAKSTVLGIALIIFLAMDIAELVAK
jgi:hypothetical protein